MVSHLLCIWLLLFLGFSYASANAELRALMEIKASLDPENRLLSSWTSGGDPCSGSFLGVVCNEHHKVGNISLPAMELTGKLSPALAELKCMSGLYLHYNKLNGEIPRELGNLTELTELYLDFNNLSGAIPPEIGRMASLQGEIPGSLGDLDVEEGSSHVLNWPTRVSIIKGIAKGMEYLHSSDANKPSIVHRNISVEKILLSQQFNPVILDSGLVKLFAEDVVYSALKVSAALGYMAPEYITTGRFTEKSDVYAFGVIILQVLSGKCMLTTSTRVAAESCNLLGFIDPNLEGRFDESEATKLAKVAMACMNEVPENRPTMAAVVEEFKEEPCDEQSFVFRIAQDEKCINGGSMKMFD